MTQPLWSDERVMTELLRRYADDSKAVTFYRALLPFIAEITNDYEARLVNQYQRIERFVELVDQLEQEQIALWHTINTQATYAEELEAQLAQTWQPAIPPDVRERLADYAHEAWSGWMKYLFEKGDFHEVGKYEDGSVAETWTMPIWAVDRWQRQMNTPYAELPESEKASDRDEADKMLAIMGNVAGMPPDVREAIAYLLANSLDEYNVTLPETKRHVDAALAWLDAQEPTND